MTYLLNCGTFSSIYHSIKNVNKFQSVHFTIAGPQTTATESDIMRASLQRKTCRTEQALWVAGYKVSELSVSEDNKCSRYKR